MSLPQPGTPLSGTVVRVHGRFCRVHDGVREVACTLRARHKQGRRRQHSRVVVGDEIRGAWVAGGEGVIEELLPRRNELARASRRLRRRSQVVVANVDLLVAVVAAAQPPLEPHLIDRLQVSAFHGGMDFALCVNKMDLAVDSSAVEGLAGVYRGLGFPVVCSSVVEGKGIDALSDALRGRRSVLAGPSGVGKSSLVNAVEPGLSLRTGEVNRKTKEGAHTTTWVELLPLGIGGYIVDTPGIRDLDIWDVPAAKLSAHMPEFAALSADCRFRDCAHLVEPDCAVRAAVEDGRVSPMRYGHYRFIHRELTQRERRGQTAGRK